MTQPIGEFFTLRRAEEAVRSYRPAQHASVQAHVAAAARRLATGRRAALPVPASLLLREAVTHTLLALALAHDAAFDEGNARAADLPMPTLPPDAARPRVEPTDDARVRAALASTDRLYFDALSPEDAEATRWALERAAVFLRGKVESRSLVAVKGARVGRAAAVLVILAWISFAVVRAVVLPKNVALHRPVTASSLKQNPPDGKELVDGDIGTSFGVHTNVEDSPRVTVDLERAYWLQTIKVYNRVDGWYDDCLPLVVEVSKDDRTYEEVARRDTHFGTSPPWVIDAGGRGARYVRVRVARHGYLALSEIEVFGRK